MDIKTKLVHQTGQQGINDSEERGRTRELQKQILKKREMMTRKMHHFNQPRNFARSR